MKSGNERVIIEQVKTEMDLGMTFDDNLLYRNHIAKESAIFIACSSACSLLFYYFYCQQKSRTHFQKFHLLKQRNVFVPL